MNSTLAYLRSRRAWLVPNLAVWGSDNEAGFFLAAVESIASETRIGFWQVSLGGQSQQVTFSSLSDNRGNNLPEIIKSPAVVVIPRGRRGAFVKSVNGETGFTIAKNEESSSAVSVDLLIFETGL